MQPTRALIAIASTFLLASCGGGGGSDATSPTPTPNPPGSTSNAITVADNSFSPSATTVTPGTTVTWTWTGGNPHDVTFDDGSGLKSTTQTAGTYARAFTAAGTYNYHCSVHGAAMSGKVTVQ